MHARDLESDFAGTRARTVTLPTSATSPWLARQLLAQWCREWAVADHVVDEAMVVVSELVTECVAVGAPMVSLTASLGADELELEVAGASGPARALPTVVVPHQDDDGAGHRMEIVRGLGTSVEVRPGVEGRTIVVAVPLHRAP
jgi:hypothetical protein